MFELIVEIKLFFVMRLKSTFAFQKKIEEILTAFQLEEKYNLPSFISYKTPPLIISFTLSLYSRIWNMYNVHMQRLCSPTPHETMENKLKFNIPLILELAGNFRLSHSSW